MNYAEIETVYELLARQVDRVGAEQSELYLAKLALLLAHRVGDLELVRGCIEDAALSLEVRHVDTNPPGPPSREGGYGSCPPSREGG